MRAAILLVCAALLLTACGKQGMLERPEPIFGQAPPTEKTTP